MNVNVHRMRTRRRMGDVQSGGGVYEPVVLLLAECPFGDQGISLGGDLLGVAAYIEDSDVRRAFEYADPWGVDVDAA